MLFVTTPKAMGILTKSLEANDFEKTYLTFKNFEGSEWRRRTESEFGCFTYQKITVAETYNAKRLETNDHLYRDVLESVGVSLYSSNNKPISAGEVDAMCLFVKHFSDLDPILFSQTIKRLQKIADTAGLINGIATLIHSQRGMKTRLESRS